MNSAVSSQSSNEDHLRNLYSQTYKENGNEAEEYKNNINVHQKNIVWEYNIIKRHFKAHQNTSMKYSPKTLFSNSSVFSMHKHIFTIAYRKRNRVKLVVLLTDLVYAIR